MTLTPNTTEERKALMDAAAAGRKITVTAIVREYEGSRSLGLLSVEAGSWNFVRYRYDIVPEPFECWVLVGAGKIIRAFCTKEDAEKTAFEWHRISEKYMSYRVVHVREVPASEGAK